MACDNYIWNCCHNGIFPFISRISKAVKLVFRKKIIIPIHNSFTIYAWEIFTQQILSRRFLSEQFFGRQLFSRRFHSRRFHSQPRKYDPNLDSLCRQFLGHQPRDRKVNVPNFTYQETQMLRSKKVEQKSANAKRREPTKLKLNFFLYIYTNGQH
jgi:hypothetical protein